MGIGNPYFLDIIKESTACLCVKEQIKCDCLKLNTLDQSYLLYKITLSEFELLVKYEDYGHGMVEIKLDSAFPTCLPLSCDVPLPTLICCLPIVFSWMISPVSSQARQECEAKAMRDSSILISGIYLAHF